jgi:hypothetical protein
VILPLLGMVDPVLALVAAPAWVAAVWAIVRQGYGAAVARRATVLSELATSLEQAARARVASRPRVRVENPPEPTEESLREEVQKGGRADA